MILGISLAVLVAGIPPSSPGVGTSPQAKLELMTEAETTTFDWHDTEDRVRGLIEPRLFKTGLASTVSVNVGSFTGPDYDGPVTLSFRPVDQVGGGYQQTTAKKPGEKSWVFALTPSEPGPHVLEVSFRTSKLKVLRGEALVREGPLPAWIGWAVGVSLVGLVIASAIAALLRVQREERAKSAGGGS